jgi:hypothetical protein
MPADYPCQHNPTQSLIFRGIVWDCVVKTGKIQNEAGLRSALDGATVIITNGLHNIIMYLNATGEFCEEKQCDKRYIQRLDK